MLALKIPLIGLIRLVWWAIKQEPEESSSRGGDGGAGPWAREKACGTGRRGGPSRGQGLGGRRHRSPAGRRPVASGPRRPGHTGGLARRDRPRRLSPLRRRDPAAGRGGADPG